MGQWVVTVAGIAILAVLCDIILPEGQTRKYIKTVIGVIVTLVMVQPLVNFLNVSAIVSDDKLGGSSYVEIQQSYLDMVDEKQLQARIAVVCDMLEARNINVEVTKIDKSEKRIILCSNSEYSTQNSTSISKMFGEYFSDYVITIEWK